MKCLLRNVESNKQQTKLKKKCIDFQKFNKKINF